MDRSRARPKTKESTNPHVVAVCGSRRAGSNTRRALVAVLTAVEAAGGTGELLDLAEMDLPPLDPDRDTAGDGEAVARRIREADAVVLGTPTYHGSFSGVLKNVLDYCRFDEFEGTTVGLLAVSGGPFPTTALDHLRDVCRALHAWVLPRQVAIPDASRAITEDGFADDAMDDRVRRLGKQVVQYASIEPEPVRAVVRPEA